MKRVRIAVWGANSGVQNGILPALSGPDLWSPPDTGPGWAKRPAGEGDIFYQPPAAPEVVAICDDNAQLLERTATSWRIRACYADPRVMLREAAPDALLIAPQADVLSNLPDFLRWVTAKMPQLRVWISGSPALCAEAARRLAEDVSGREGSLWIARTLSRALAHRAAQRAVEGGEIGAISALSLRWNAPFPVADDAENARRTAGAYAAFSLLLQAAAWRSVRATTRAESEVSLETSRHSATPHSVVAHAHEGATSAWLRLESGASAIALFAGADAWSSDLPRLEITGTNGRFLVCAGGRRLTLHVPREPARTHEPPASWFPSAPNVAGISDELRAFLAWCATGEARAEAASAELLGAVRALETVESVSRALRSGEMVRLAGTCEVAENSSALLQDSAAETGIARLAPRAAPRAPALRTPREKLPTADAPALPL